MGAVLSPTRVVSLVKLYAHRIAGRSGEPTTMASSHGVVVVTSVCQGLMASYK